MPNLPEEIRIVWTTILVIWLSVVFALWLRDTITKKTMKIPARHAALVFTKTGEFDRMVYAYYSSSVSAKRSDTIQIIPENEVLIISTEFEAADGKKIFIPPIQLRVYCHRAASLARVYGDKWRQRLQDKAQKALELHGALFTEEQLAEKETLRYLFGRVFIAVAEDSLWGFDLLLVADEEEDTGFNYNDIPALLDRASPYPVYPVDPWLEEDWENDEVT